MKSFSIAILVVFCLATFMVMADNSQHTESGLIRILQSVLTDPEFLRLNKQLQLDVIIAMYQFLEQQFKKTKDENNKVFPFEQAFNIKK
jgi:hypothetical protein